VLAAWQPRHYPSRAPYASRRNWAPGWCSRGASIRGRAQLTARVLRAPGGEVHFRVEPVTGPVDSLPDLVRQVATRLVAGLSSGRRAVDRDPGTASTAAFRAYALGRAAYRRGAYGEATRHLAAALRADPDYALAAFWLVQAATWNDAAFSSDSVWRVAERLKHRLAERERVLLDALFAGRPDQKPFRERLAAAERAVTVAPEAPEAWWSLGDAYYHAGEYLGVPGALERAWEALIRAFERDSGGPALWHALVAGAHLGDTARVRQAWRWGRGVGVPGHLTGSQGSCWATRPSSGPGAAARMPKANRI